MTSQSWHKTRYETPHVTRFEVVMSNRRDDSRVMMGREVRAGLVRSPRSIPPKYFYDERGSRLFDAICDLPEYYLTRAEASLLKRHAEGIVERAQPTALVEIGSGMARKTRVLIEALCMRTPSPRYIPFDIAREPMEASAPALLASYPRLKICGLVGDFSRDLPQLPQAAPPSAGPRLFALLGSTIGNLDERAAPQLVHSVAQLLTERDTFLLGVDLVKEERLLHAAYNDAQGVTAAFNKNVLRVLSRELDGNLDERAFDHLAFYDGERQRVEMHLVARRRLTVTLKAIDLRVELAAGERVLTEISRKFTRASVGRMLAVGGMRLREWLVSDGGAFALCVAERG
jgi:L-histidine N-alpha-methyltransferase